MKPWQIAAGKKRGTVATRKSAYDVQAPLDLKRRPKIIYPCGWNTLRDMCDLSPVHCRETDHNNCRRFQERGLRNP